MTAQQEAELAEIDTITEQIYGQLQDLANAGTGGRPYSRLMALEDIQSEVESWIDILREELDDGVE